MSATFLGRTVRLTTGRGLFSADRLDDGTRLLLAHLPPALAHDDADVDVLDLGCGYGALGLPIAAARPRTRLTLVDRDLVAVAYAAGNAATLGLANAHCEGGLGYRDLPPDARFDVVLCNVPARLGDASDRAPVRGRCRAAASRAARSTRSSSATSGPWSSASTRPHARSHGARGTSSTHALRAPRRHAPRTTPHVYARDTVTLDGRALARPHDLGEDPAHLREALPLLLDVLPRHCPARRALVLRGGYGVAALALAARGADVVAADRDLLATAFTRRNAALHGLAVETREVAWLPDAARDGERFDLVVAETSDAGGTDATLREITSVRKRLTPRGEALWLTRGKHVDALVRALEAHGRAPRPLATRGSFAVLRDAP